jgi:hypothetical protein
VAKAKSKAKKLPLLFVDTNIWLDFYRQRQSDVALELLAKLESVNEHIVVTHVLDMEYRKNRHLAIAEGLKALAVPAPLATHGIFSQAKAAKAIDKNLKEAAKHIGTLRKRLVKALKDPIHHDKVYQTCQRIFHRESDLVLCLESDRRLRASIRERALRRFYLGCPPRKADDTSLGDALNWEWMVHCAEQRNCDLVILTRDSDYGMKIEKQLYVNDQLSQEFKDRVSQQKKVHLYDSSVQALKHFDVKVSQAAESEETTPDAVPPLDLDSVLRQLREVVARIQADLRVGILNTSEKPSATVASAEAAPPGPGGAAVEGTEP